MAAGWKRRGPAPGTASVRDGRPGVGGGGGRIVAVPLPQPQGFLALARWGRAKPNRRAGPGPAGKSAGARKPPYCGRSAGLVAHRAVAGGVGPLVGPARSGLTAVWRGGPLRQVAAGRLLVPPCPSSPSYSPPLSARGLGPGPRLRRAGRRWSLRFAPVLREPLWLGRKRIAPESWRLLTPGLQLARGTSLPCARENLARGALIALYAGGGQHPTVPISACLQMADGAVLPFFSLSSDAVWT